MTNRVYVGSFFIAEHGSWNRSTPIGYRITFVGLKGNRPTSYETFAEGWLEGGQPWGRPVDVLGMPDGALLVFPYCHGGDIADDQFGSKHACSEHHGQMSPVRRRRASCA
jgi:glucose/arabinose dehydrogenase